MAEIKLPDQSNSSDVVKPPRYPSNRKVNPDKEETLKTKEITKIISGTAVKRKKGVGNKLKEAFFGDGAINVGEFVLYDVIVPSLKNLVYEAMTGGLGTMLFGSKRDNRFTRTGAQSFINYGGFSTNNRASLDARDRKNLSYQARASHDFDQIIFPSRLDAENVLIQLVDLTVDFGMASVADLYGYSGIDSSHVDHKYGWTDLRQANVTPVRGGYVLNLPRPILLD